MKKNRFLSLPRQTFFSSVCPISAILCGILFSAASNVSAASGTSAVSGTSVASGTSAASGTSEISKISGTSTSENASECAAQTPVPAVIGAVPDSEAHWLGPCDLVLSPDGSQLWTACLDSSEIIQTETQTDQPVRSIALPAPPTGLAISGDGKRLFVTCDPAVQVLLPSRPQPTIRNPQLICLNTETAETLWSVECGEGAQSPILSPDEKRLYLCARFSNRLEAYEIEPEVKLLQSVPMDREPFSCAVTPDGKKIVVSNLLINAKTQDEYFIVGKTALVDSENWTVQWVDFPNGTLNIRGVCVSPDGKYAYVLHSMGSYAIPTGQVKGGWINMNSISFIDLETGERTGTQTLDHYTFAAANPWGIDCSKDGKWLVVTHAGTMDVSVIERLAMHENFETSLAPYPAIGATPDHAEDLLPTQKRVFTSGRGPRAVRIASEIEENGEKRTYAYVANYFSDTVERILLADNPFNPGRTIHLSRKVTAPTIQRIGESLFHDGQLCFEQWQSCATCHPDARSDALNWDLLNDGSGTPKNTKSMLYAHRTAPSMAVGVRVNAEAAVRKGIELIHFTAPQEPDANAIDAYLKALEARRAPILREAERDPEVQSSIQRGRRLFFGPKTQCSSCHTGEYFTDMRLHDVGSSTTVENRPMDTPTLRECWRTAPYFHDGRFLTIFEMLKDGRHGFTADLTDQELRDLEAFVLSL